MVSPLAHLLLSTVCEEGATRYNMNTCEAVQCDAMQRSALNNSNQQSTITIDSKQWVATGALAQIASSSFYFLRLSLPSPSTGTEERQTGIREGEKEAKKPL